jgi:hypothetical protein
MDTVLEPTAANSNKAERLGIRASLKFFLSILFQVSVEDYCQLDLAGETPGNSARKFFSFTGV